MCAERRSELRNKDLPKGPYSLRPACSVSNAGSSCLQEAGRLGGDPVVDCRVAVPDNTGRNARDHGKGLDIPSDDGTSRHHGAAPDGHPGQQHSACGDPRHILNDHWGRKAAEVNGVDIVGGGENLRVTRDVDVRAHSDAATGVDAAVVTDDGTGADFELFDFQEHAVAHDMAALTESHAQPAIDRVAQPRDRYPVNEEVAEIGSIHIDIKIRIGIVPRHGN